MGERALTVRDLCDRYAVGEHSVLGWIRSGELRALNVGRRPGSKKTPLANHARSPGVL